MATPTEETIVKNKIDKIDANSINMFADVPENDLTDGYRERIDSANTQIVDDYLFEDTDLEEKEKTGPKTDDLEVSTNTELKTESLDLYEDEPITDDADVEPSDVTTPSADVPPDKVQPLTETKEEKRKRFEKEDEQAAKELKSIVKPVINATIGTSGLGPAVRDIGKFIAESPQVALHGLSSAADELLDTVKGASIDVAMILEEEFNMPIHKIQLVDPLSGQLNVEFVKGNLERTDRNSTLFEWVDEPESKTGHLVSAITQFAAGWIVTKKILPGKKLAAESKVVDALRNIFAGGVADVAVFDEQDMRLSNLLEQFPSLQNPVTDYLKADPNDSYAQSKLKQFIEGMALGSVGEVLIGTLRAHQLAKSKIDEITGQKVEIDRSLPDTEISKISAKESDELFIIKSVDEEFGDNFIKVKVGDGSKAININLNRIENVDDINEVIKKIAKLSAKEIDEARRGKIKNKELKNLADDLGLTVSQLNKRRKGQAFNAEEILASRQLLAANSALVKKLTQKVVNKQANDVDKLLFHKMLAYQNVVQKQVSGMTAEAGRALQQFNIKVEGNILDAKFVDQALEALSHPNMTVDQVAEKLAQAYSVSDSAASHMLRNIDKATTPEMLTEIWINSLLSSPATHLVNVIGNTMAAVWQVPERFIAAAFTDDISFREAFYQAYGLMQGMQEGIVLAARTMKSGEATGTLTKVEGLHRPAITSNNLNLSADSMTGKAVDFFGNWLVRTPGRLLMSSDEFFKAVGYRMELNARSFRMASEEGLKGKELHERMAQIMKDPPEDLKMAAIDAAHYQTFTNRLGDTGSMFDTAGKKLQDLSQSNPLLKLVIPFVRTPANIAKFTAERTPLGLFSTKIRNTIKAGGPDAAIAKARIASGSMMAMTFVGLSNTGQITGEHPPNAESKEAWLRKGWKPYSIKIGDTWHTYNRLDPIGQLIGLAADATQIINMSNKDDDVNNMDVGALLSLAFANNIVNKTYMQGLSELMGVLNQPTAALKTRALADFFENTATTFLTSIPIPVARGTMVAMRREVDPIVRDVDNIFDSLKNKIPGLSSTLPARTNLWGEDILYTPGELNVFGIEFPSWVQPIYSSKGNYSPVDDEIINNNMPISMPKRTMTIQGLSIRLTPEQYHKYIELMNEPIERHGTMKEHLSKLLSSARYRNADNTAEIRGDMFLRVINARRKRAKMKLFKEDADLKQQLNDHIEEKRSRG